MDHLKEVQEIRAHHHGCKARHLGTERVEEVFRGATIWRGRVEPFQIKGHPKAEFCYAWGYEEEGRFKAATVLQILPVTSPGERCKQRLGITRNKG